MAPRPLVFVPGLPGTKLFDAASHDELFPNLAALLSGAMRPKLLSQLSGPDVPGTAAGVVPGDPIRWVIDVLRGSFIDFSGTLKQAASLYDILNDLGYGITDSSFGNLFRPVGWDWRLPVDQAATLARVRSAITDLHQSSGGKVTLLCHSTGGLVVRSLLEAEPVLADLLERVIAIGIPWVGTLQPFPMLAGQGGWGPFTAAETQRVLGHSWAAFDLLPPDPAQTDMTDGAGPLDFFTTGAGQASPLVETSWIPAGSAFDALRNRAASANARLGRRSRELGLGGRSLEVVQIVGWGASTLTGCHLDAQHAPQFVRSQEGDGTVPRRSAGWLQGNAVRQFLVPIGHYPDSDLSREHINLWQNRPARDLLATLLAGDPWQPYTYAAVDPADAVAVDQQRVGVYLVALDQAGQPLPGAYATAVGMNPPDPTHYLMDQSGLGTMPLRRENIGQAATHEIYRFQVQFHWQEAGVEKTSPPQTFRVMKPG